MRSNGGGSFLRMFCSVSLISLACGQMRRRRRQACAASEWARDRPVWAAAAAARAAQSAWASAIRPVRAAPPAAHSSAADCARSTASRSSAGPRRSARPAPSAHSGAEWRNRKQRGAARPTRGEDGGIETVTSWRREREQCGPGETRKTRAMKAMFLTASTGAVSARPLYIPIRTTGRARILAGRNRFRRPNAYRRCLRDRAR